ncbi:isochorismate synthase [Ancylobacter sonchi]|uniref:isochorismate synthase n=1 Tax=Ancylobacter sonchi TaxID=1937790 RepID=UPI001FE2CD48|nr:isochorismate synthase [Ancylobacter sonchi]
MMKTSEMTDREATAGEAPAAALSSFVLVGAGETVVANGCRPIPVAAGVSLARQAGDALADARGGAPVLVGALPYDHARPAHLLRPASWSRQPGRSAARAFGTPALVRADATPHWQVTAEPSLAIYRAAVAEALARMERQPALRKVVLSRALRVAGDRPIDARALLGRLAEDPAATAFCVPLPPQGGAGRLLVGATPELLVSRQGDVVLSHPLAGSARRSADPRLDREAAEGLVASAKDQREHREVVTAILDQLAPHCRELGTPEGTQIVSTASMWHLGTRIVGRLHDMTLSSLDLAALLHPTPAVCGTPRDAAAAVITELEGHDRGFYAGAVGWCEANGDGAWYVALRCAEIAGNEARLHAGAGVVPGSDPVAEGEETAAKFAAMLRALGLDEAIAFDGAAR